MRSVEASAYAVRESAEFVEQHWDRWDGQLAEAQDYLALLEADPATDELTIVVARHAVLQCKRGVAWAVAGES